jgi:predicted ATP-binding protein involved in virulence
MRLDKLTLKNFRCYKNREFIFHPRVNLIVGQNAAGKTAILDAVSIAIATWFLGFKKKLDGKGILPSDATLTHSIQGNEHIFVESWPVVVSATGIVDGKKIQWERSKSSETGNTRYGLASELIKEAKSCDENLDKALYLPLISYYGTMRLWQDPRIKKTKINLSKNYRPTRLDGYIHSVDPRISVKEFIQWFAKQEWMTFQQGQESVIFTAVKKAVIDCIDGATALRYDAGREELLLTTVAHGSQPFSMLSDGQRCILALVSDIAQKAAKLNPHLGGDVLCKTPGIVLVDELDLHLHPLWQRSIIDKLRETFPQIQFIFTTHSPFLIQSLRSGEELLMLEGQPTAEIANKTLEDIAIGIMGVESVDASERYLEMKGVAIEYLKALDKAPKSPSEKLEDYKERLAQSLAPYSDNPAFQAFLEMQQIAKFGGE